jgi:hypothetical protein
MSTAPKIESYRFGHVVVDGESHDRDLIVLPHGTLGGWWRREGHVLHPDDLEAVFEAAPEVLVVGQGAYGRMAVARETERALDEAQIELVAQPTEKACQTYNQLRAERAVAAALHLTC